MKSTSRQIVNGSRDSSERVRRWTAALITVLVHALLVLLVMPPDPIAVIPPQGDAGGSSSMEVTLIDKTAPPSPPAPPEPMPIARKKPKAPRVITHHPPTPIVESTIPTPPESAETPDTATTAPPNSEPAEAPRDAAERPAHVWGQPPGMVSDAAARANAALAAKLGSNRSGNSNPAPAGPSMDVDGFHVYYGEVDETRLRAWRDRGMTELFLPLPGTLKLMVCPLEVALRHGSGACHMVAMDAPELKSIGDAREVINIQRVYQLGDMVWSGPGAYR